MTHTLHRIYDSGLPRDDFLIVAMAAKDQNYIGSKEKLVQILKICEESGAVNLGDTQKGSIFSLKSLQTLFDRMVDGAIAGALFDNQDNIFRAIKEIKNADLGISVVVTGNIKKIERICDKFKIRPHTIAVSIGLKGRLDKLPSKTSLQIMTMCGHGMITHAMVKKNCEDFKKGLKSSSEAVSQMAKCCVCGCFNPTNAKALIERYAKN